MRKYWLFFIVIAAVLLTSCGGRQPTAAEILAQSAETMTQVDSLKFYIERQGEPVQINVGMGVASVVSADGVYRAPDNVYAVAKVELSGAVAEAEVLWITDGIYLTFPPFLNDFTPIDLSEIFDAAEIFSDAEGIPYVLRDVLSEAELVGEEDVEGITTYHITGTAEGEELGGLVGGVVAPGTATVDVWIDKETSEVARITLSEADGNGWLLDFYDYGEPVEIPTP
jgi:outer membrane lipoprotein-sorting protein